MLGRAVVGDEAQALSLSLRHVSAMLGRAVTDAELGRIMRAYDAAGDGVLSFAEFHAWIRGSEGGA